MKKVEKKANDRKQCIKKLYNLLEEKERIIKLNEKENQNKSESDLSVNPTKTNFNCEQSYLKLIQVFQRQSTLHSSIE